jgi:hypothetical protein
MGTAKRRFNILKLFRFAVVFLSVLGFPYFLAAQTDTSGSHVVKTGEGFLLSQTISFPLIPNTLYYKIEIEELAGENFISLDTIQTETNSIEVSLKAGLYRYRILAYNRMNLLDGVSDWQEFQVLAAIEPAAEAYQPVYGLYYEMSNTAGSITIIGRDFFPESEFALIKQDTLFDWSGVDLEGRKDVIFPSQVTVSDDHNLAVLVFSRKDLKPGKYLIFIRNPGGLWTTMGEVRAGFKNDNDFTLSFGWSPMIAAFDRGKATFYEYNAYYGYSERKPLLDPVNLRGAYMRWGWLPIKTRIGNFGLELNWLFLVDNYWVFQHGGPGIGDYFSALSAGHIDIVYQYAPITLRNWQFDIRAGAGAGNEYDYTYIHDGNAALPFPLMLNFGFSVQYFIWKNLYAEAGMDFQYMLGVNHFMLRPALGLGWQFGRWAEAAEVDRVLKRGEDPSVPVTGIPKNERTLSVGWSPMIPLFNYTYHKETYHTVYSPYGTYTYRAWDGSENADMGAFNPLGAYLRTAYLPHRWGNNKLGFEFAIYVLEHPNRNTYEDYRYIDLLRYVQFGVLYQRRLPKDWQLNARLGAGISNPYDPGAEDVNIPFAMNAGLSVQRFFWKGLYAEAGLDMVVSFGRDTHWMLSPGIGIGWQFNRDTETGLRLK